MLRISKDRSRRRAQMVASQLEALEDRRLQACGITLTSPASLRIAPDPARTHVVEINDDGTGNRGNIRVRCDGQESTFSGNAINFIGVNLGSGNDTVRYNLNSDFFAGGLRGGQTRTLDFRTGDGDDRVALTFNGSVFGPALGERSSLNAAIDTGVGVDRVETRLEGSAFAPSMARNSSLSVVANLGPNPATAIESSVMTVADDLDPGAFLAYVALGGDGPDNLRFESRNRIASGASENVDLRGGAAGDFMGVDYAGRLDGTLSVRTDCGTSGGTNFEDFVSIRTKGAINGLLDFNVVGSTFRDLIIIDVTPDGGSTGRIGTPSRPATIRRNGGADMVVLRIRPAPRLTQNVVTLP